MKVHLALNFPIPKCGLDKTLCGQNTVCIMEYSLSMEMESTARTISEIIRAAAMDDKDTLCNECLAEFFENVSPLNWRTNEKKLQKDQRQKREEGEGTKKE
ncbi:MAG: hypothetical protein M3258_05245 [Thermoproteota archaeon]|nr:hypothetical protein [Thermoproteota archaeon]